MPSLLLGFFFGQLAVNQFEQFGQGVVLRQPVAVAAYRFG